MIISPIYEKYISVETVAGSTTKGYQDGAPINAKFDTPYDVDLDKFGNVYVADFNNSVVRKIMTNGTVVTIAGQYKKYGIVDDELGTNAILYAPWSIVVDKESGIVYVCERRSVRKLMPYENKTGNTKYRTYVIARYPGDNMMEFQDTPLSDGSGNAVYSIGVLYSIAIGPDGMIYVLDGMYRVIRRLTPVAGSQYYYVKTVISTFPTSNSNLVDILADEHGLFVSDGDSNLMYFTMPPNPANTWPLSYTMGIINVNGDYIDGDKDIFTGAVGRLSRDRFGNLYFCGYRNSVRKFSVGAEQVATLAGKSVTIGSIGFANGNGADALFGRPQGIASNADGTAVYVADSENHAIRKVNISPLKDFSVRLYKNWNLLGFPIDDSQNTIANQPVPTGYNSAISGTPDSLVCKISKTIMGSNFSCDRLKTSPKENWVTEIQHFDAAQQLTKTSVIGFGGDLSEINGSDAYFIRIKDKDTIGGVPYTFPSSGVDITYVGFPWPFSSNDVKQIVLRRGMNWINFPKKDYVTVQALFDVYSGITQVIRYDADVQLYKSATRMASEFDDISGGIGYMVQSSQDRVIITFNGSGWVS